LSRRKGTKGIIYKETASIVHVSSKQVPSTEQHRCKVMILLLLAARTKLQRDEGTKNWLESQWGSGGSQ